jgi:hypothetical protein
LSRKPKGKPKEKKTFKKRFYFLDELDEIQKTSMRK